MTETTDSAAVQQESERLLMELWRRNYRANSRLIESNGGVARLFGRFMGLPAIVVGAGPSLDKNLPFLNAMAGRLLIVAVDAALHSLQSVGVEPDLIVTFDPQESVNNFFRDLLLEESCLVAPTIAHPAVTTRWKGELIFYNKTAPDIPLLASIMKSASALGELLPGGSVSTVAMDLAVRLGADPIAFIGQDLCYLPGKSTHAEGAIYDSATDDLLNQRRERVVETDDLYGRAVLTETNMLIYKEWMEWYFESGVRKGAPPLSNCTEGGIVNCGADGFVSAGCQTLSLAEWMARLSTPLPVHDFRSRIKELMAHSGQP